MKKLSIVYIVIGFLMVAPAYAQLFGFNNISNNSGVAGDLANQLFVDVSVQGSRVQFKFFNDGSDPILPLISNPIDSFIGQIYFDDALSLLSDPTFAAASTTSPGVKFIVPVPPPPFNFPEGNNVGFDEDFKVEADSPGTNKDGIDVGEMLGVLFYYDNNKYFSDVITAITNSELRMGLHVQGIMPENGDYSDSFVNNTNPVPEPTTMLLLGSGLVGLAGFGRKKFFKKN